MENKPKAIRKQTPKQITQFGTKAAKQLVDIVKQNQWSVNIQGNDYLKFEAWQTLGRFFNYTVRTDRTNPVEIDGIKGFEASASVLDNAGVVIGGAEAVCMRDEKQWASKPLYALKSMAQTRASARAFRQILSWVVVLAGYNPTPVEEMSTEVQEDIKKEKAINAWPDASDRPSTEPQRKMIFAIIRQKGLKKDVVLKTIKAYYRIDSLSDLKLLQAKKVIDSLLKKPNLNADSQPIQYDKPTNN